MMVNPSVRFDELPDPLTIKYFHLLDPAPRSEDDGGRKWWFCVWFKNNVLAIAFNEGHELFDGACRNARRIIMHNHAAVLKIVELELVGNLFIVDTGNSFTADVRA